MKRLLALLLALVLLAGFAACGLPAASELSDSAGASAAGLEKAGFSVKFLDVGQADSALLCCGGHWMLIDGGNVEDGSYVVSALTKEGVKSLDYVVNTHADEDHCGGLAGVLAKFPAQHVWSSAKSYSSKAFSNFVKYAQKQGRSVEIPKAGDSFKLGAAEVTVLGPIKKYDGNNNNSIVLRVVYGKTSFLFTGDAEREEEKDILDSGAELSATVLKVGHHGSDTSTSYVFLREIMPKYAVISVGKDNDYGHPDKTTLSRLRDAGVTTFRTDLQGTVTAVSDGKTVTMTTEKQADQQAVNPTSASKTQYIGNTNTKVFHAPDCARLPAEANRIYFDSYEDAIAAGYHPHAACVGKSG
jgi:competence protein ComEC